MIHAEVKEYNKHKYLFYNDNEKKLSFDNMHYYIIDISSKEYKEKEQNNHGGFCGTIMDRYIIQHNLKDIEKILFISVPQNNEKFIFYFYYLDSKNNIVDSAGYSDNIFDFNFFKNNFSEYICEEGITFDFVKNPKYKRIADSIGTEPTNKLGFQINDKDVILGDKFIIYDYSNIFEKEFEKKLKNIGVEYLILHYYLNPMLVGYKINFYFKDNSQVLKYHTYGDKTKAEFIQKYLDKYKNDNLTVDDVPNSYFEPYYETLSLKAFSHFIKNLNLFTSYSQEQEPQKQDKTER